MQHKSNIYMVRNHQDGYPYINLSQFFCCWKYTETSIFLEKLIGQWIPNRNRRGIARDIKKIISTFKTWQKMVKKSGQFKKLKWPFSSLQFCIFFFFLKFRTAIGEELLGMSKKMISLFKTWQKIVTKLG